MHIATIWISSVLIIELLQSCLCLYTADCVAWELFGLPRHYIRHYTLRDILTGSGWPSLLLVRRWMHFIISKDNSLSHIFSVAHFPTTKYIGQWVTQKLSRFEPVFLSMYRAVTRAGWANRKHSQSHSPSIFPCFADQTSIVF